MLESPNRKRASFTFLQVVHKAVKMKLACGSIESQLVKKRKQASCSQAFRLFRRIKGVLGNCLLLRFAQLAVASHPAPIVKSIDFFFHQCSPTRSLPSAIDEEAEQDERKIDQKNRKKH